MIKYLQLLSKYFTEEVHEKKWLQIFCMLVYAWLLIQSIFLFSAHKELWGTEKIFHRLGYPDSFIENFFFQLVYESGRSPWVYALHIVCSFLSILSFLPIVYKVGNKLTRLLSNLAALAVRVITWATGLMLFYAAIEAFDGGMLLMLLLAFYCSFAFPHSDNAYLIATTNASRLACMAQICIVYLCAALYKWGGSQWPNGSALYYTLHIEHFTSGWWKHFAESNYFITQLMTWSGLAYQTLFPIIVWWKKLRTPLFAVGVLFHLFIGLVLGLWAFALAMIIGYIVFFQTKKRQHTAGLIVE